MRSFGHINMQQNELQESVIQVETNFPALPVPGRLVFKNQILYICISIATGTPVWIPLTNEIESFEYVQSASSDSWTITHNLGTTLPSVQVYGADNKVVYPDDIEIITNNVVKVSFSRPQTGRAVVLTGSQTGMPRTQYAAEYTQTTPSTTWTIQHNLGYNPIVRIFVGMEEVQPMSITHDSLFQTTVRFTQAFVGIARLI
jgi:hypothetical protein